MEKIKRKLAEAGYKMTGPRLAVLDFLAENRLPVSARRLHRQIRQFDRASVYRALNLFAGLRLVNAEIVAREKVYCLADKPHHHIVCRKCGYSEKIDCRHHFDNFNNFTDVYHQLTLSGVCYKCVKR